MLVEMVATWAVATASLCAVVLFVNIDLHNVSRHLSATVSPEVEMNIQHRARFVLLGVTIAVLVIYAAASAVFFYHLGTLETTMNKVIEQFMCFFSNLDVRRLKDAPLVVRQSDELDIIGEYHDFNVATFSRYREVANAQQEMSLASLWLREFKKYLPEHLIDDTALGLDGAGGGGETEGTSRTLSDAYPSRSTGGGAPDTVSRVSLPGRGSSRIPGTEPGSVGSSVAARGTAPQERVATHRRDPHPLPARAFQGEHSKILRRRTSSIVVVSYPDALFAHQNNSGTERAAEFLSITMRHCLSFKGLPLTRQPDCVMMCWNAFQRQPDHEEIAIRCMQAIEAELNDVLPALPHAPPPPFAVGISGNVIVGRQDIDTSKHPVLYGHCVNVLDQVRNLVNLHQIKGLSGRCVWLSQTPNLYNGRLLAYDFVSTAEGEDYILYRILGGAAVPLPAYEAGLYQCLSAAFSRFHAGNYEAAQAVLNDAESFVSKLRAQGDQTGSCGNAMILQSVWRWLILLSSACVRYGIQYTQQVPDWTRFGSDHIDEKPLPSDDTRGSPSGDSALRDRGQACVEAGEVQSVTAQNPVAATTALTDVGAMCHGRPPLSAPPLAVEGCIADQDGMEFRLTTKILGRSYTSVVTLALSGDSGSFVAVKSIKFIVDNGAKRLTRAATRRKRDEGYTIVKDVNSILGEVNTMSELRSELIVGYVTAILSAEKLFIVMEYVSGGSLSDIMRSHGGTMPLQLSRRYLRESLEGLSYLHSKGVLHCDVKPQNVLVPDRGPCKLSDFGLSVKISEATNNNQPVSGTRQYCAPEGSRTEKSDVYSFGVMLGEVVTGEAPPNPGFVLSTSEPRGAVVPSLLNERPDLAEARAVFDACTRLDPDERPSAKEILQMPFFKRSISHAS